MRRYTSRRLVGCRANCLSQTPHAALRIAGGSPATPGCQITLTQYSTMRPRGFLELRSLFLFSDLLTHGIHQSAAGKGVPLDTPPSEPTPRSSTFDNVGTPMRLTCLNQILRKGPRPPLVLTSQTWLSCFSRVSRLAALGRSDAFPFFAWRRQNFFC